ncbi:TetR/AcrR family transcriptional regulator [Paenibacillus guangzhouensis]|uniref:TetR/AcrR family transcriptional regulator n=1 Tax=Paenibacillus guangzhouensis TaxID=1473112 RepID=UPI001266F815|nr:TetR/AcrR family transcriptional regulator [Paenibacillus guangzhouensis]
MIIDRRKQVVEAASKSFALFGYKATTMDQIAKIANVGKGTIYTFFANKEELFDEILQQVIQELGHIVEAEIQADKPFFENLYRVLDRSLDYRSQHELVIQLSHEVKDFGTQKANEGLSKIESTILQYIEQAIRQGIAKNELRACDPAVTSFVMLKLYVALTAEWRKTHEPLEKEAIKEYFRLYFIEGLSPKV